jgi:hypothetical protein
VREALAREPDLAGQLIEPEASPLLAPLVCPPLDGHQSAGLDLILEGFLLHHGLARHLAPAEPGREVLTGDYCYAHGLVRIADSGDLFVIEALADLIALGAGLVAAGDRAALVPLWRATTVAIASRHGDDGGDMAARYLAARRVLETDGDRGPLEVIAARLPPTPELDAALR